MNVEINILGLKNAEKFSSICQNYPVELYLRSGQFCVDPKSMLEIGRASCRERVCMFV